MAKQLKINIKNAQIAQALQSTKPKEESAGEKSERAEKEQRPKRKSSPSPKASAETKAPAKGSKDLKKEETPKVKARTKSAFSGPVSESTPVKEAPKDIKEGERRSLDTPALKPNAALRRELFGAEGEEELARSQQANKRPNPLLQDVETDLSDRPSTAQREFMAPAKTPLKERASPDPTSLEPISRSQAFKTPEPTISPMASNQSESAVVKESTSLPPPPSSFNYPKKLSPSAHSESDEPESRSASHEYEPETRHHGREQGSQGGYRHKEDQRRDDSRREGQGSRPPYGERREGGREGYSPRPPYGERREGGREGQGPRPPYGERREGGREGQGPRPPYGERREGGREGQGPRPPYGERREGGREGQGPRPPYGERREGGREGQGPRPPYGERREGGREGQGPRPPYGERREGGREGQGPRPPYGERREGGREGQGPRPPYGERREGGREGQGPRPPYGERREGGREGQGPRPPYGERREGGREGHGPRPPYGERREGHGPRPYGERREGQYPPRFSEPREKLGPTGKHINDLLPPRHQSRSRSDMPIPTDQAIPGKVLEARGSADRDKRSKSKPKGFGTALEEEFSGQEKSSAVKGTKFKDFHDVKSTRRKETSAFDARDRQGLRGMEEGDGGTGWRKRKHKVAAKQEDTTIRPTSLKIRLPIVLKDLAAEMKLKSSQLVAKLFLQGITVTLNDILEDEVIVQLLGQEFGCDIQVDTSDEERIRITDKTAKEEIAEFDPEQLSLRAPVVAFMGHVDHGKTSLIDAIRQSNRAAHEAGAITQHIGAFRCSTAVGQITILDTPGHEAFSAMRARGADVTDIVVLVIAGDEGIRAQTVEAIQHAKAAHVTIVVALNKCDKPNFNPENVYRQLADQDLLPEAWGGSIITVNCSAVTGEGINTLLEMLAIQAEVLELKAVRNTRARGRVLESEMHKGLGAVATVLVQNGTLRKNDCVVFGQHWGRIKTMQDEYGVELDEAGPSTPVAITGLSGLPEAGNEFIAVKNEKEAREISEARTAGVRLIQMQQKKKVSLESFLQQTAGSTKKVLNLILRADVQGSLEALKVALMKVQSSKVDINIILAGVGEVSESDVQLAATSKAIVIGFHTRVEAHTEPLIKELGIQVRMHDIIYHAIDDVRVLMSGLLDKIAKEETRGSALVKTIFKSSAHGVIAGCQVIEGSIHRNHLIRVLRKGEQVWKGQILSLKRVKEDVREVQKGIECGILLNNYNDVQENDILEAYEIIYLTQEL